MIKDLREKGVSYVDIWGEVYSWQREESMQSPYGEKTPGIEENHRMRKETVEAEVRKIL